MASPTRTRSGVHLHGDLPIPGVWSYDGQGSRNRRFNLGDDLVPMSTKSYQQPFQRNTFFQDGGAGSVAPILYDHAAGAAVPRAKPAAAREINLDHALVGATTTTGTGTGNVSSAMPKAMMASSASSSYLYSTRSSAVAAPARVSAIRLEDPGSWPSWCDSPGMGGSPVGGAASSPQRQFVDGAWRLNLSASASSPELPTRRQQQPQQPQQQSSAQYFVQQSDALSRSRASLLNDDGKKLVPTASERRVQLENAELASERSAAMAQDRRRGIESDLQTLEQWDVKWGYPNRRLAHYEVSPSRKKFDPAQSMRPTLVGFELGRSSVQGGW